MSKSKVNGRTILSIVFGVVLIAATFLFFTKVLKFNSSINDEIKDPSFFDLIFGLKHQSSVTIASITINYSWTFPCVSVLLVLFILHLLIDAGIIALIILFIVKKVNNKTLTNLFAIIGCLAFVCGVLSLCSSYFASSSVFAYSIGSANFTDTIGDVAHINFGAIMYGFVMVVSGLICTYPFALNCYDGRRR